jgi:hypothetical protein
MTVSKRREKVALFTKNQVAIPLIYKGDHLIIGFD